MYRNDGCTTMSLLLVFLSLFAGSAAGQADAGSRAGWPAGVTGGDCDDTNSSVYPGRDEVAVNFIDDDCDGLADEDANNNPSSNITDADGDGHSPASGDCNDTNPAVNPAAAEVPGNLIDDDCDGLADEDAMGNPSPDMADHDGDGVTIGFDLIFRSGFEILP